MKIFVTFGTDDYKSACDFACKKAKEKGGFDKIIQYSFRDIDSDFKKNNNRILSIKRGAGLWLWKPYFILKSLEDVANDGDFVFYCDSGAYFINKVDYILNSMKNTDIWVSDINLSEKQFTKEDAFNIMDCDDIKYKESPQIQGTFICLKKTQHSIYFVKRWLECCCNYDLICPENVNPGLKNCSEFVAHREDQSILSLLSKKMGIIPHQDPSQRNLTYHGYADFNDYIYLPTNHKKEYPVCIYIYRGKSPEKYSKIKISFFVFKSYLYAILNILFGIKYSDILKLKKRIKS